MDYSRKGDLGRLVGAFVFLSSLATVGVLAISPAVGASVPVWLDDAITEWNSENPAAPIRFVDIKNSFVWYRTAKSPEINHKRVRDGVYNIAEKNNYIRTEQEELITTAKPPSPTNPYSAKKCWKRSFTLDLEAGRQRLLTTLVCDDTGYWYAGFRVAD